MESNEQSAQRTARCRLWGITIERVISEQAV